MAITIKEIADRANTSIATVSRVMNEPEKVAEPTRKKILNIMHEHNYRKNQLARGLVSGRSQIISLITPDNDGFFSAFYFKQLFLGINKGASGRGYCVLIDQRTNGDAALLDEHVPVDGYILISPSLNSPVIEKFQAGSVPAVLINRKVDNFSWVDIDNIAAIVEITNHLVALGHQNIGLITGGDNIQNSVERVAGYKRALEMNSITFNPSYVLNGRFTETGAYRQVDRMMTENLPVTAFLACNDLMAVGAIKAIKKNGLRVPEDIAVVGFDDIDGICFFNPAITTYRQPFFAMGHYASNLLIDHIEGKREELKNKKFRGKLVLRESCGAYLNGMAV